MCIFFLGFLQNNASENEQKIVTNILSWITRGQFSKKWRVEQLTNRSLKEATAHDTVLVWQGAHPRDTEMIEGLTSFVSEGGSVIIGVTPWGSMQILNCEVDDLPCYQFLTQVGIFLSDEYDDSTGTEVIVANNKAKSAHLDGSLQKCATDEVRFSKMNAETIAEVAQIFDNENKA